MVGSEPNGLHLVQQLNNWGVEEEAGKFSPLALLPIAGCIAYIWPACISAYAGRVWHMFVFTTMAVTAVMHQVCDTGNQVLLGKYVTCSSFMRTSLAYASEGWAHFCFLQVCFVVLGPEDPWLYTGVKSSYLTGMQGAPRDIMFITRICPIVVLTVDFALRHGGEESRDLWFLGWARRALLSNIILCFGCAAFWTSNNVRRTQAIEVLLRLRFWVRVASRLVIPFVCFMPVVYGAEILGWRVLRAAEHVGCAAIAAGALGAILPGKVEVLDRSPHNWPIAPCLLVSVALVLLPTVFGALFFDVIFCGAEPLTYQNSGRWPTLSASSLSPEGHFVLAFGTPPLLLASAGTVWMIESALVCRPPSDAHPAWWSPWERKLPIVIPAVPIKQRETLRWLGCRLLYGSLFCGAMAVLFAQSTPIAQALHLASIVPFFIFTWAGIILVTAGADNSTMFGLFRISVALVISNGLILRLCIYLLANEYIPNALSIPRSVYATVEYTVFVALGLYPVTWMEDVRVACITSSECRHRSL